MAYTPPAGDAVNFTANIPIIIPVCNAVDFNISANVVNIVIQDSIINIFGTDFYYLTTDYIRPELTILKLFSTDQSVNPVAVVGIPTTVISPLLSNSDVQPCPDIITIPSIIIPMSLDLGIDGNREFDLPIGLNGSVNFKWDKTSFVTDQISSGWDEAIPVDEFCDILANDALPTDSKEIVGTWNKMDYVDNRTAVTINSPMYPLYSDTSTMWEQFFIVDEHCSIVCGSFHINDADLHLNWNAPGPNDREITIKWDSFSIVNRGLVIKWNSPFPKDHELVVPWGPIEYFTYCQTKYFAPDDGVVNFKLKKQDSDMIGICMSVVFDVEGLNTDPRCPYKHYQSGSRDPFSDNGGVDVHVNYPYTPPLKEQYYMMNTVLVKRLPDNVPIEVTSISIKYDWQSWLWSFSLTIGKDKNEYLELIKPNPLNADIFTDIEIYINGWKWVCRVESWDESRVFAKDSWRISGRSPSMELGYPQNVKTSYIYDPSNGASSTAGGQIIDDILEGTMVGLPDTNWSVDWSAYIGTPKIHTGFDPNDASYWGIKDGSFSWTSKTQIEAIKQLTESIGAFIITNPDCSSAANKKLIIRPKYDQAPWHWNTSNVYRPNIDHVINTSYTTEVGSNYSQMPDYTSVYSMGQASTDAQRENTNSGIVIVEVFRDGIGPGSRVYGEDIVSPYIFNWQAAVEAGRMKLCETGEWLTHRLRLFSLAEKTDTAPLINGLILPGDFVQINEKSKTWYGMSTSTEITASVVNNSAFAVYQTIEVNQYIGN